jgi:hypothetical protein
LAVALQLHDPEARKCAESNPPAIRGQRRLHDAPRVGRRVQGRQLVKAEGSDNPPNVGYEWNDGRLTSRDIDPMQLASVSRDYGL